MSHEVWPAWFGPKGPWAPACDHLPKVPTPVGEQCARCARAIEPDDEGEILRVVKNFAPLEVCRSPIHWDCLAFSITGSIFCQARGPGVDEKHKHYHSLVNSGIRPAQAERMAKEFSPN